MQQILAELEEKVEFVFRETLKIHRKLPSTRIASSLSPLELYTALYYGQLIDFKIENNMPRDIVIFSKGHGSISMYPILYDLGFVSRKDYESIGNYFSIFGSIPDPMIPGYETVNGSLGHGIGVGCGIALSYKKKKYLNKVIIIVGDGELQEGSNWEALMFAERMNLDNLYIIVDCNNAQMLGKTSRELHAVSIKSKFESFGASVKIVNNGHSLKELYTVLKLFFRQTSQPNVLIVNTIKGNRINKLVNSPIPHVISLTKQEIDDVLQKKERE